MRLPWSREPELETRDQSFTDAVVSQLLASAAGIDTGVDATAAVEIVSGIWGRAFSAAEVRPQNRATAGLTPTVLESIGRSLMQYGEAVFEIVVDGGQVRLDRASTWTITGGSDPRSWLYECTFPGPSRVRVRVLTQERIVHVKYSESREQPWRGVGPLQSAHTSGALLGYLESRLRQEMSGPVGHLIPVPTVSNQDKLLDDLKALKGQLTLVESTAKGWTQGTHAAPRSDFDVKRIGADPPETLEPLRNSTSRAILAAAGVSAYVLADQGAQGAAAREGYRQFLHSALIPVSKLVAQQIGDKLDTPDLRFDHSELMASDLAGRARAFGQLVTAGIEISQAAALTGLLMNEEAA